MAQGFQELRGSQPEVIEQVPRPLGFSVVFPRRTILDPCNNYGIKSDRDGNTKAHILSHLWWQQFKVGEPHKAGAAFE